MTVTAGSSASAAPFASSVAELYRTVGAAIHGRLVVVAGGDETRARADSETLFVRYYLRFHRRALAGRAAGTGDAGARVGWVYRVATAYPLRALGDDARPGRAGAGAVPTPWQSPVPPMRVLRGFDEATQAVVVLDRLDGLTASEIAEVLELTPAQVERKLAEVAKAGAEPAATGPADGKGGAHPSRLALDRDPRDAAVTSHLAACDACRAATEEADRAVAVFVAGVSSEVVDRIVRAIRAEEARLVSGPNWKRIGWLGGAFVIVTAMAFTVARPRELKPGETPFRGGGASRAKAAGLQITARRGTDVGALAPGMFSRIGDRLHFRLRAEGPRYLEVRARSPQGGEVRIFPASGNVAVRVAPGDALDRDYVLGPPVATPGHWLVVEGLSAEHEFPLDKRPGPDIEIVPVRIDIEP